MPKHFWHDPALRLICQNRNQIRIKLLKKAWTLKMCRPKKPNFKHFWTHAYLPEIIYIFRFSNVNFVQLEKLWINKKITKTFIIVGGVPKCLKLIYLRAQITTPHCEHCGKSNSMRKPLDIYHSALSIFATLN